MIKDLMEIDSVARYLTRIGAEIRSIRTAVVKIKHGKYWTDVAIIKFDKIGQVECPKEYEPTPNEQQDIINDFQYANLPEVVKLRVLPELPPHIAGADPRNLFIFYDEFQNISMLQLRVERNGEKNYIPYTFWSDGEWRALEPEGKLPLWGIDAIKTHETVFIHEGAKAARAMREIVEEGRDHPWGEEMAHAAHIGWIGGALSPHRTDWSILTRQGVKTAYIVSDNDPAGVSAVPAIAFHVKCPTFQVQFTNEWPTSFDLADPFPSKMFSEIGGNRYYIGPSFLSCVHPATWATDAIPQKKGKPIIKLRDHFKKMWAYAEEQDIYVCVDMPEIVRSEAVMNKMLTAFSHSPKTASLLQKNYSGRRAKLCYRPDLEGRIITENNSSAINLHTPTHIKSKHGNEQPWLDFMEYLVPNTMEREIVLDWCTTLIAHPEVKIDYGMLLVSEAQGVGKTTLGSGILAPLVGLHNASHPSEQMITNSDFNEWLAGKRLIIVNEIYSGHSWKAYNKLKSIITDKTIDVNKKFQATYTIDNWSHIFACSNSRRALKMESEDRRWFTPEVTETPWGKERFVELHAWLAGGGLSIIKAWAEKRPTWVQKGDRAPMNATKQRMIQDSRSEAQQEVSALALAINESKKPVSLAMKEIVSWVRGRVQGKVFDTDADLRKIMREDGCSIYGTRIKISGQPQYVVLSCHEEFRTATPGFIRDCLENPSDILGGM